MRIDNVTISACTTEVIPRSASHFSTTSSQLSGVMASSIEPRISSKLEWGEDEEVYGEEIVE